MSSVRMAAGVSPKIQNDPFGIQMPMQEVQNPVNIERIRDLYTRMGRQNDVENAVIKQSYTMADITLRGVLVATEKAASRYDEQ